jgi:hypothetical protein
MTTTAENLSKAAGDTGERVKADTLGEKGEQL